MPILPDDRTSVSWKLVDGRMLGPIFLTRGGSGKKRLWGFSDVCGPVIGEAKYKGVRGPVIGEIEYKGPASGTVDVWGYVMGTRYVQTGPGTRSIALSGG